MDRLGIPASEKLHNSGRRAHFRLHEKLV